MIKCIWAILFVLALASCATAYQPSGATGGFSETRLDENVFRVSFNGNGYTSRERASDFALMRSAELTLQAGYSYFVIVDGANYTSHSSYTTPATSYTSGSAYAYGNSVYGNATTTTYGGQTFNFAKPSTSNTIVCLKEEPQGAFAYNAQFIFRSLSQKYGLVGGSSSSASKDVIQEEPSGETAEYYYVEKGDEAEGQECVEDTGWPPSGKLLCKPLSPQ